MEDQYSETMLALDPRRQDYLDALARGGFVPVPGSATTSYRWPSVDAKTHPARHTRVPVQRRSGPRASRFNDLERT